MNQITSGLVQLSKSKETLMQLKEDVERLKPDYPKALQRIGKKGLVPYLDPKKQVTKAEIEHKHAELLTSVKACKNNLTNAINALEDLFKYLKEF
jgi:predicted transcriptional regulator